MPFETWSIFEPPLDEIFRRNRLGPVKWQYQAAVAEAAVGTAALQQLIIVVYMYLQTVGFAFPIKRKSMAIQ